MKWTQVYDPFGNILVSAVMASIPLLAVAYMLGVRKMSSHVSVSVALALTAIDACLAFQMPVVTMVSSAILGLAVAIFICPILIGAITFYQALNMSGQFATIRRSISVLTPDPRLQMLLVGFCFGAFLEAIAGGGTPVAITVAMLTGLGFGAFYAAKLCLLCDSTPVAFGAVGLPLIMTGLVTGIPLPTVAVMLGRQIPVVSLLIPPLVIFAMSGWRGVAGVWPAVLVTSVVFSGIQFAVANLGSPYLPDVAASILALVASVVLLTRWRPREIWAFPAGAFDSASILPQPTPASLVREAPLTTSEVVKAWLPVAIMVMVVGIWGFPRANHLITLTDVKFPWPELNGIVFRAPPIEKAVVPYSAVFNMNWLSNAGSGILIATLISTLLGQGLRGGLLLFGRALVAACYQLRFGLLTAVVVTMLAWIMNYSGMTATMALAFALTGMALPFFSAFMGWIGVFVTGSDTNAAALFGSLQALAATKVGLSPLLTAATNIAGGATAKMLSPLELAIATSAGNLSGREGDLFRQVLLWSLELTAVIGLIALCQAYLFTWMIP